MLAIALIKFKRSFGCRDFFGPSDLGSFKRELIQGWIRISAWAMVRIDNS